MSCLRCGQFKALVPEKTFCWSCRKPTDDVKVSPPAPYPGVICADWTFLSDRRVARCDKPEKHEGEHVDSVILVGWPNEPRAEELARVVVGGHELTPAQVQALRNALAQVREKRVLTGGNLAIARWLLGLISPFISV